jgi:tRNA G18 (ribose-2'-O)-methylase SpoU
MSGFFGIGIQNIKTESNLGTLWRSANIFGASFIFTIGRRYREQCSDTLKTPRAIPLYHFPDFEMFYNSMPFDCQLVGVEMHEKAAMLPAYKHPKRCVYLLGAEDHGLSKVAIDKCVGIVQVPTAKEFCLNVASTGTVIMYYRLSKKGK